MTLGEQQRLFVSLLPKLISYAYGMGYELTLGDGYRDPRVFGALGEAKGYGHSKSAHKQRLAIDLNLFKDGKFLVASEEHKFLGTYWKTLHPLNRWGGDFTKTVNGETIPTPDGNHYSQERAGIQ